MVSGEEIYTSESLYWTNCTSTATLYRRRNGEIWVRDRNKHRHISYYHWTYFSSDESTNCTPLPNPPPVNICYAKQTHKERRDYSFKKGKCLSLLKLVIEEPDRPTGKPFKQVSRPLDKNRRWLGLLERNF